MREALGIVPLPLRAGGTIPTPREGRSVPVREATFAQQRNSKFVISRREITNFDFKFFELVKLSL